MPKMLSASKRAAVRPMRLARQRQGLTRRELAAKLGITERTLFSWERGAAPRKPKMDAWARALGIS